ncbi:hypothetical protein F5Y18DRAFT_431165 [Xylariaceae sp. FL1019]|nr:hypothetical protein F5Y18DRAFT_431165 [Xylariaceae sp. FL1019]
MDDNETPGSSNRLTELDDTNVQQQDHSNDTGGERPARVRVSKPKIKTGCNNCKWRRIKCDEQRPACSQCVRSKKLCTGYPPPSKSTLRIPLAPSPHIGVSSAGISVEVLARPEKTDQSILALETHSHSQATRKFDRHIQPSDTVVERVKHRRDFASLLLGAAIGLLRRTVKASKNDQSGKGSKVTIALTRALQALVVWDERHSVSEGRLDAVLEMSKRVRNTALSSLRKIVITVSKDIIPKLSGDASLREAVAEGFDTNQHILDQVVDEDPENDSDTRDGIDDDDADRETATLDDHLNDLDGYIRGLNDLDSSLITPAMDPATVTSSTSTSRRIRDPFPEVSDYLAERLGQSNWERYCFILATREQAAKGGEEDDAPLDIEDTLRNPSRYGSSRRGAITLPDSGLGMSLQTYTTFQSQLSSAISGMGDGPYSSFPALSKEAKAGKPFQCDGCGRPVVVTRSRWWKKHLLEDLQPYICIVPGCEVARTPFPSQTAWSEHVRSRHSSTEFLQNLCCPFCKVSAPRNVPGMLTHIAKHLEVISAIALPRCDPNEAVEESSQSMSTATNSASDEVLRNVAKFVESNAATQSVSF